MFARLCVASLPIYFSLCVCLALCVNHRLFPVRILFLSVTTKKNGCKKTIFTCVPHTKAEAPGAGVTSFSFFCL